MRTVTTSVHARSVGIITPHEMTDEQLATADELCRETMSLFESEGDRPRLMRLFAQHCAIIKESKDRMAKAHAARGRR